MRPIEKPRGGRVIPLYDGKPAAAGGFTFINVSEPKQSKDKNLRKFVRSHAMRTYRRNEKQKAVIEREQSKDFKVQKTGCPHVEALAEGYNDWPTGWEGVITEAQALIQPSSQPLGSGEAELDNHSLESACSHSECNENRCIFLPHPECPDSSPKKVLGDGMSDPFDVYPSAGCPRYDSYVLHHCKRPLSASDFLIGTFLTLAKISSLILALVVSVMARNCLPMDPGNGSNPLTKVWVPYAITDPVLFLATLNFAAVHLNILRGQYNSPSTLMHKGETIRLINARLQKPTESLTNETIGSVAMLAATESMNGNCKDLRVHMDALAKMVKIRGGLRELGWGGVLHMFISWQDLLSSAMTASPPHFAQTPCCAVLNGDLPFPGPMTPLVPTIGRSTELCEELMTTFHNMRYLTDSLTTWGRSITSNDLMSFSKQRSTLEHRLLILQIRKTKEEMTHLEYILEACRIASLIYLKCVLHNFRPFCAILRNLKEQLINLLCEAEGKFPDDIDTQLQRGLLIWIMFMGGILSLNEEEEWWFARRIAHLTKGWHLQGPDRWSNIEERLREISWVDSLKTPECMSLWNRVESIFKMGSGHLYLQNSQFIGVCPVEKPLLGQV